MGHQKHDVGRNQEKALEDEGELVAVGAGQGAFLVFRNAFTDTVNVLFRRPDGNLGLIEPEV